MTDRRLIDDAILMLRRFGFTYPQIGLRVGLDPFEVRAAVSLIAATLPEQPTPDESPLDPGASWTGEPTPRDFPGRWHPPEPATARKGGTAEQRETRNRAIHALRGRGFSYGELAELFGLSTTRVHQIAHREAKRRAAPEISDTRLRFVWRRLLGSGALDVPERLQVSGQLPPDSDRAVTPRPDSGGLSTRNPSESQG